VLSVTRIEPTGNRLLDVQILRIFKYLDLHGSQRATSEVQLGLVNGQNMSIAAGGRGVKSAPLGPPFLTYEVTLDHDPPRFWNKYTDDVGLLYAFIPRLLISHHITRHGGIDQYRFLAPASKPGPLWTAPACFGWYI
jgi:hypothetical protein